VEVTHWTPTRLYPSYKGIRRWAVFRWVSDGQGKAREQRMDPDGSWHDTAAVWHPRPKDRWRIRDLGWVGDETGPRSLHATVTTETIREKRELELAAKAVTVADMLKNVWPETTTPYEELWHEHQDDDDGA
jgi:hypothetical protein